MDTNNWYAIFTPARTPPAVIDALNDAVRRTAESGGQRKASGERRDPAASSPQALDAILKRDTEKRGRVIRQKKITPQG